MISQYTKPYILMDPILPELQAAAAGLLFRSESDYPFETVDLGRAKYLEPTPAQLLEMLDLPVGTPARTVDLAYFLRNMTRTSPEQSPAMQEEAARFQALERLFVERLAHVQVIRLGEVQVEAFLLGSTPTGRLVGLKTRLVET